MLLLVVSLAGVSAGVGQTTSDTPKKPAFEVASMRMSPPDHGSTTLSPPGASTFVVTNVSAEDFDSAGIRDRRQQNRGKAGVVRHGV